MVGDTINRYRNTSGICFPGQGEEERLSDKRPKRKEGNYKRVWQKMVRGLYEFNSFAANKDRLMVATANFCWASMGNCRDYVKRSLLDVMDSRFRIANHIREFSRDDTEIPSTEESRESISGGDR